jgi:biopolymer transport protein ExbB
MNTNHHEFEKPSLGKSLRSAFAAIVIPLAIAIAICFFIFVLGSPKNFQGGVIDKDPLNYLGTVHQGGVIVPIIIGVLLILITISIERLITVSRASGKGKVDNFVRKIRIFLANNDIDGAIAACDKQKGSVANVVRSGLEKYKAVFNEKTLDKERKAVAIQKELEEATTLELPMLSKNLVIVSTCASIGTLFGLLGTVLGMIKSFAAMAHGGAPDAVQLAAGISEALINTALGIGTSALAIILYNFFTNKIDALTYGIDEAGFTIVETFNTNCADK